jgi:DNA-binding MarR family transcriptional regulator
MKPKKKKYTTADQSPGFLLWQSATAWQKKVADALDQVGLSHVQFVLLVGLQNFFNKNEETTQTRLASITNTDVMMTSQVLRKLEARGLVKRKAHETDSRAKKIVITKKGTEAVDEGIRVVEDVDADFFEPISKEVEKLGLILQGFKVSE